MQVLTLLLRMLLGLAILGGLCPPIAFAVTFAGTVKGVVTDPSGARVPNAHISLSSVSAVNHAPTRQAKSVVTDAYGNFHMQDLLPGIYLMVVTAKGFEPFSQENVQLVAGQVVKLDVSLKVQSDTQQVTVSGQSGGLDTSSDANADAITLEGADLDTLPNDGQAMLAQLAAMLGVNAADVDLLIDGFSSNSLPPKAAIRAIRLNGSPYSAQYDSFGSRRIEVFTKVGTEKFRGGLWSEGNASSFNSANPFVQEEPPYHSYGIQADLSGPIKKDITFFVTSGRQAAENNAIINAVVLGPDLSQQPFTQAISSPTVGLNIMPRVDLQLGAANTLGVRSMILETSQENSGVGQFALAAQALQTSDDQQIWQFSAMHAYGARIVNQTQFQYIGDRTRSLPVSSAATLSVEGAFTDGGSSAGETDDHQDRYEIQDNFSLLHGAHTVKVGGRLRLLSDMNRSTAGFNGNFTFPSLTAYQITEQGLANGQTSAEIRAAGGGASQYSVTTGVPRVSVFQGDVGLYVQDDWNVLPNLTISYGLRLEIQNNIHRQANLGPRFGIAWGPGTSRTGPGKTILRAGFGYFYRRFDAQYVLQAKRQDGTNQEEYIVNSPDSYPNPPMLNVADPVVIPTVYRISSTLHAPRAMMADIGVERQLSRSATLSIQYLYSRGTHQLSSRNINAPLPGTYTPGDPTSGVRPLGAIGNIYEYESSGVSRQDRLGATLRVNAGGRVSLFVSYTLNNEKADAGGAGSFPSNEYDLGADYGRTLNDISHRAILGGYIKLPYSFEVSPFVMAQSGQPFNIVVGEDLNGDSQFNDRPTFATDLSRPSVVRTRWGALDTSPTAEQTTIPINYGTATPQWTANLRLEKAFYFGPEKAGQETIGGPGLASSMAKHATARAAPGRYTLSFGALAGNVFNHVNLAAPVGTLGSPLFGQSNALAGSSSANRLIELETQFRF